MPDFDPDLIEPYGLRPLSAKEQRIFPGLELALDVFKAHLAASIPILSGDQAGWVLWMAETYPGQNLLALPGGSRLHVEYHGIQWERVPADTPVTTLDHVRAGERRRQEAAQKWWPGQAITTPGTRLRWDCLAGWVEVWEVLQRRRVSSTR